MSSPLNVVIGFTIAIVLYPSELFSQNLVSDPGFENYNDLFCGILTPGAFDQMMADWSNPSQASPQMYFTDNDPSCFNHQPNSTYSGPFGLKGSQMPLEGSAMAGLWCYTIEDLNQRHYVQTVLSEPLEIGETYKVGFYASLADAMEFGIDRLGAVLTSDAISTPGDGPIAATPQVEVDYVLLESEEWVLISDTIVADEAYTYFTVGNFYDDQETTTISNPNATGGLSTYGAFYFIDSVFVERISDVSILSNSEESAVQVFPTYVTQQLSIKASYPGVCEIYASTGKLVYAVNVQKGLNQYDLSLLANGAYLVSVVTKEGVYSTRVIK